MPSRRARRSPLVARWIAGVGGAVPAPSPSPSCAHLAGPSSRGGWRQGTCRSGRIPAPRGGGKWGAPPPHRGRRSDAIRVAPIVHDGVTRSAGLAVGHHDCVLWTRRPSRLRARGAPETPTRRMQPRAHRSSARRARAGTAGTARCTPGKRDGSTGNGGPRRRPLCPGTRGMKRLFKPATPIRCTAQPLDRPRAGVGGFQTIFTSQVRTWLERRPESVRWQL